MDRILARLSRDAARPLEDIRRRMAPGYRAHPAFEAPGDAWREAAVLILLYAHEGSVRFPLMLRPAGRSVHASQISLPGGSREGSESLEDCALRETNEELGVESRTVSIVRPLSALRVPPSRFVITPFVGIVDSKPLFRPSESEVAELFDSSVDDLLDPALKDSDAVEFAGALWSVPCYRLGGRRVWGATAMILAEFEAIIAGA